MLERLLDPAVDRQSERLSARLRIREILVERPFHAGDAVAVDIGVAEHMRGEGRLRIQAVRFALDRETRLAERVHRFHQRRRRTAAQVKEGLAGLQKREILFFALLGHQLGEATRESELVADHLAGMDRDRPRVDRARERIAIAVDDVAAFGHQRGQPLLSPGMVAEGGQVEDPERDDRDDTGIDQHAKHQPLMHHRQQLAALADESEPLGPWRDESGRRCVHRSGVESLGLPGCLAGSGASGSTFASRIGFVTGLVAATAGLSTVFLAGAEAAFSGPFFVECWAAARPGFSTDLAKGLAGAGLAAFAGSSVDLAVVWGNATTDRAGTSRVSVFRLASWSNTLGATAAGAPESSISGSPIGSCLVGAGAEASTTGAWKSS